VKLDAVDRSGFVFDGGDDVAGRRRCRKSAGQPGHVVAVAHPNVELEGKLVEQGGLAAQHLERRGAVLAPRGRLARAAEVDRDELHPVTNAEDRDVDPVIKVGSHARSVRIGHTRRTSRKYYTLWPPCIDRLGRQVKRMYLAIDALLAHAPCDQLCILRAKIEDDDSFVIQAAYSVQLIKSHYTCVAGDCQEAGQRAVVRCTAPDP
jgi:hypothetical protein